MQLLAPHQIANFPVNYFSPSSIRAYLDNRQSFFKRYIRLEFNDSTWPAAVEWSLFHAIVEDYWNAQKEWYEEDFDALFEKNFQQFEIDWKRNAVNRWKTGSKEKSIAVVKQAVEFYKAELPKFQKIEWTEIKFISDFEDLDGNSMPIPLKGFVDMIVSEDGNFDLEDHKLVTNIVETWTPCPKFEIQAASYWFTVRKELGINPRRMIFRQIKKSKNTFDWSIEELEAIFETNWIEFFEVSEKTQIIEIAKANWFSDFTFPAVKKEVSELSAAEIKQILTDAWIDFKKSLKKEELIDVCYSAEIFIIEVPEKTVWIEALKTKEIKQILTDAQIPFEIVSKKDQMVQFWISKWMIELKPQIVPYIVEYNSELLETFLELYRRIVKELAWMPLIDQETWIVQFLPNPYAQFGGDEAREDFKEEVSGKVRTLDDILVNKTNRFADNNFEALEL